MVSTFIVMKITISHKEINTRDRAFLPEHLQHDVGQPAVRPGNAQPLFCRRRAGNGVDPMNKYWGVLDLRLCCDPCESVLIRSEAFS